MTEDLKPCPLDNGEAVLITESLDERMGYNKQYTIKCRSCGLKIVGESKRGEAGWMDDPKFEGRAAVIKAWNTRIIDSRTKAMADDLKARLRQAAEAQSETSRMMAETKSLRQHDCDPPRADLYMWQTPEQTVEGKALARIEALEAGLEEVTTLLERYCTETPLGHSPHMIFAKASDAVERALALLATPGVEG